MRHSTRTVATLTMTSLSILLATTASAWAQNLGQGFGRGGGLNIGAMARQVFNQSDRNNDTILNRSEFGTAQLLTSNAVASLGRAGMIGRGRSLNQTQLMAGPLFQGGMLLGQGGLNLQITNTNHVTQPQFTNYFQNAVARGDAYWRQLYAMNRRTNGQAYPRYGRGYGTSPYRNYGNGSYRPSVMSDRVAPATATNPVQTGTNSSTPTVGSHPAGATTGLPGGVNIVGEGGSVTLTGPFYGEHHRKHNNSGSASGTTTGTAANSKTASTAGKTAKTSSPALSTSALSKSSLVSSSPESARARVTAMAQARAAARRAYSAGGGYGGGGFGGGMPSGGGGYHGRGGHMGGGHMGGGAHAGGGHHR